MNFESKLVPIKADASFRKFYRKKIKKKSSIIVYAEKEKIQNLLNMIVVIVGFVILHRVPLLMK